MLGKPIRVEAATTDVTLTKAGRSGIFVRDTATATATATNDHVVDVDVGVGLVFGLLNSVTKLGIAIVVAVFAVAVKTILSIDQATTRITAFEFIVEVSVIINVSVGGSVVFCGLVVLIQLI